MAEKMDPLHGKCKLIDLPRISDARGNLTFMESGRHAPFDFKRIFYLYDVPGGAARGGHAHRESHQFLIAMSGQFDVVLNDGLAKRRFHLDRPDQGLYMCPMMWGELEGFSAGSVCMVLTSSYYSEADYLREYEAYLDARRAS